MTAPMPEFMERGAVIIGWFLKCGFGREVDQIVDASVECLIVPIMQDLGPGVLEDLFRTLNDLPFWMLPRFVFRDALDLFPVKDGVDPMNGALVSWRHLA